MDEGVTSCFLGLRWRYLSAVFSAYNANHSYALAITRTTTQLRDGSTTKFPFQCSETTRQVNPCWTMNLNFKHICSPTWGVHFTRCQHHLKIRKICTPPPKAILYLLGCKYPALICSIYNYLLGSAAAIRSVPVYSDFVVPINLRIHVMWKSPLPDLPGQG